MLDAAPIAAGSGTLPARIGRYRILCELGYGAMAVLYLGRAAGPGSFGRLFAIKTIHAHLGREDAFVQMFLNEARIAARIQHPNVVSVYEVDVDQGRYYLSMDYVSGETLALTLKHTWNVGRAFPLEMAAHIISRACEGLHAAHELRDAQGTPLHVVHRDVAPQNLMIGYDGAIRVMDFGIAKSGDQGQLTQPGSLKGTVAYMAPEQIRGGPIDRRADIFALGTILWETTVGKRLFKSTNDINTAARVLRMNVPPPSSLREDYPPRLEEIVMRALARAPEARYQTARSLGEDLEDFLTSHGRRVLPADVERFARDVFADIHEQRAEMERKASLPEPPERLQSLHNRGLEGDLPGVAVDPEIVEQGLMSLEMGAEREPAPAGGDPGSAPLAAAPAAEPSAEVPAPDEPRDDRAALEVTAVGPTEQRWVATQVIRQRDPGALGAVPIELGREASQPDLTFSAWRGPAAPGLAPSPELLARGHLPAWLAPRTDRIPTLPMAPDMLGDPKTSVRSRGGGSLEAVNFSATIEVLSAGSHLEPALLEVRPRGATEPTGAGVAPGRELADSTSPDFRPQRRAALGGAVLAIVVLALAVHAGVGAHWSGAPAVRAPASIPPKPDPDPRGGRATSPAASEAARGGLVEPPAPAPEPHEADAPAAGGPAAAPKGEPILSSGVNADPGSPRAALQVDHGGPARAEPRPARARHPHPHPRPRPASKPRQAEPLLFGPKDL